MKVCREVDEVRKRGFNEEENTTDLEEGETKEERQAKLVNLCRYLHIFVIALHIDWLGEECAEQHKELREHQCYFI